MGLNLGYYQLIYSQIPRILLVLQLLLLLLILLLVLLMPQLLYTTVLVTAAAPVAAADVLIATIVISTAANTPFASAAPNSVPELTAAADVSAATPTAVHFMIRCCLPCFTSCCCSLC